MKYSAHYIIYTALSTLYLRALHPDCMFGIKQLNNKDMDVPLVCFDYSSAVFLYKCFVFFFIFMCVTQSKLIA